MISATSGRVSPRAASSARAPASTSSTAGLASMRHPGAGRAQSIRRTTRGVGRASSARTAAHEAKTPPRSTPTWPTPWRTDVRAHASTAVEKGAPVSRAARARAMAARVVAAFEPVSQSEPSQPSRSLRKGARRRASSAADAIAAARTDACGSMFHLHSILRPLCRPALRRAVRRADEGTALWAKRHPPPTARLGRREPFPLFCHGCPRWEHRKRSAISAED